MMHSYQYALAFLLLSFAVSPAQAQIYVDADAGGAGNGSSWTDAYTNLQDALAAAGSSDEIWIAEGVYYPDEGADIPDAKDDTSFVITGNQDGLQVYGGFEGTESSRSAREPTVHRTVLSGDVDQNDNNKTAEGITPTAADISGANSNHVLVFNAGAGFKTYVSDDITNATILGGVIVTAGLADGTNARHERQGGGIHCDGGAKRDTEERCSPTLRNVDFRGNEAGRGGAIYNQTIGTDVGGISSPRILGATFAENTAVAGGAIYNDATGGGRSNPQIINATFTGNSAQTGGAIFSFGSGGTSSPQITNATFTGNLATRTSNGAAGNGGAIYNTSSVGTSNPKITNTIFWDNRADANGDAVFNDGSGASATLNYSIVEGGDAGIANGDGFSSGTGNLDKDPQFADASTPAGSDGLLGTPDDGLRLQGPGSTGGASPAIDAGDNNAIAQSDDLIGNDRTQQVVGNSATVDMGAYESTGSALPVELTSFQGTRTANGEVRLTWRTASETGNAGFDVLRATGDGGSWTEVGFREGAGTTSQPQTYRLTDTDLPYAADSLRYRLRQVDTDGTTTLTDPVTMALGGPAQLALLGTAPNPARGRATVRFAVPDGVEGETVTLQLYDVLGRQVRAVDVRAEAGRQTQPLDVNGLTSGIYILRLQAGGAALSRKVTVMR